MTSESTPEKNPDPSSNGFGRRMTDAYWDEWLDIFRQHPGETVKVAGLMGVPRNKARVIWHHGYPKQGRPPMRDVIEGEKAAARDLRAELEAEAPRGVQGRDARAHKTEAPAKEVEAPGDAIIQNAAVGIIVERDRKRRRAQADAAKTRAQEGVLVSVSRGNAIALAAATANLLIGAQELAARMEKMLRFDDIPLREAMGLMQKISIMARMNAEAAKNAIEMERVIMGTPDGDAERHVSGGKLTPQEAAEWLQLGMKTVQKFQKREALRGDIQDAKASGANNRGTAIVVARDDADDTEDDTDVIEVGRVG
jgi:hypothetical protein